jgi:uncharacterized protein (TIGR02246 family)
MKKTSNKDSNAVAISTGSTKESNLKPDRLSKTYAAIDQLHQMDLDTFKTRDIDTQVKLVTEDCVMLPPAMRPLCGREAIRNYLTDKFREWGPYAVALCDQQFEEVKLIGDMAYEWGTFRGVYYMKNGGPEIFENSRLFRILRSQPDGSWKIARVMWHDIP